MILHHDSQLKALLETRQSIALVGASPKPWRDSFAVMVFLLEQGYQVTPINPNFAGEVLLGRRVYASLADCPAPIDLVDIFRNSEEAGDVVSQAIAEQERLGLRAI